MNQTASNNIKQIVESAVIQVELDFRPSTPETH